MLNNIFLKRHRFFPLCLAMILISIATFTTSANSNIEPNPNQLSYVVIGAFAFKNNAIRFTAYARERSLDASYELNPDRNLYYVYCFTSDNVEDAVREVYKIRTMSGFSDAWVFKGSLGPQAVKESPKVNTLNKPSADDFYEAPTVIAEEDVKMIDDEEPVIEEDEPEMDMDMDEPEPAVDEEEDEDSDDQLVTKDGYYYFYLNAINKKTFKEVKGNVNVLDLERVKEIAKLETHKLEELKDPNNRTGRIKLATDIFGFREIQHELSLNNPVNDTTDAYVTMIGDSIIVDFELERFKKGDVLVMYNVYFYIDAAIMKPESVYELNSFLDMLRENEKLKVRIHGHTNGNSQGKIIHLNPEDKNFFSLGGNHLESTGSAKKLSHFRAETIKEWLVQQGISEERMDIKGWGGKKMLYDKFDALAHKNVRVEVEIIAE